MAQVKEKAASSSSPPGESATSKAQLHPQEVEESRAGLSTEETLSKDKAPQENPTKPSPAQDHSKDKPPSITTETISKGNFSSDKPPQQSVTQKPSGDVQQSSAEPRQTPCTAADKAVPEHNLNGNNSQLKDDSGFHVTMLNNVKNSDSGICIDSNINGEGEVISENAPKSLDREEQRHSGSDQADANGNEACSGCNEPQQGYDVPEGAQAQNSPTPVSPPNTRKERKLLRGKKKGSQEGNLFPHFNKDPNKDDAFEHCCLKPKVYAVILMLFEKTLQIFRVAETANDGAFIKY